MRAGLLAWLERLERFGKGAENAVLVTLLTAMILAAVGQIILRLFFSAGYVWADELISLTVLWIALVASVAAARSDRHLRIDALSHFVPQKFSRFPRIIVDLFASIICGVLCYQAYRYVQLLKEFEDTVLTGIPAWIVFLVAPISLGLMAYRFFLLSAKGALGLSDAAAPETVEPQ